MRLDDGRFEKVIRSAMEMRRGMEEALPGMAFFDLGSHAQGTPLLRGDGEQGQDEFEEMLAGLGAACADRGVRRLYVLVESLEMRMRNHEEALETLEALKSGASPMDPEVVHPENAERCIMVSEILFEKPNASRVAKIPLKTIGRKQAEVCEPEVAEDHFCPIFHPVMDGWTRYRAGRFPIL